MPGGDRTGPLGMGPMTGRAAGFCAEFGMPGYINPVPGRGFGMGLGRGRSFGGGGRGWRHWFHATGLPGWMRFGYEGPLPNPYAVPPVGVPTPEAEKNFLMNQAEALQNQIDEIQKRLKELETETEKK